MTHSNFRLPADWEEHQCTWLCWPRNQDTWGSLLPEIEIFYSELVNTIGRFENVKLITEDTQSLPSQLDIHESSLQIIKSPTDDCWIRDYGAICCRDKNSGKPILYNFGFNAWGKKYPLWQNDNKIPEVMARHHELKIKSVDMVLEGGSLDSNGCGGLISTTRCLLNNNRNPKKNRQEIETVLNECFSLEQIIWLTSREQLAGDDTDGHIDAVVRYINSDTVLCAVEHDKSDANYTLLKSHISELQESRQNSLEVIEVPMPSPVIVQGTRTPASYLNFIFLNGAVLVPVFEEAGDEKVLVQFEGLFPGKNIIPINSRLLTYGRGGLHCITSHVFAN